MVQELDRFVRVKADLTSAEDATTQALTKQYAILGVPTLVFIDAKGNETASARLTGFQPADVLLQSAQSVK